MPASDYLFTSESVTEGHPDKVADQISDAVLDADPRPGPTSRVACETLVKTGLRRVAGEITTSAWVDYPKLVRETVKRDRLHRQRRWASTATPAPCSSRSSSSRPTSRRASATTRSGRRRPGHDVRLRLRRDARADAGADRTRPPLTRQLAEGAQERRSTSCARTARARSRSSTRTASRRASTRSSSRRSTRRTSSTRSSARPSARRSSRRRCRRSSSTGRPSSSSTRRAAS